MRHFGSQDLEGNEEALAGRPDADVLKQRDGVRLGEEGELGDAHRGGEIHEVLEVVLLPRLTQMGLLYGD